VDRKGLNFAWWRWLAGGDLLGGLLVLPWWPITALISLSLWLGEIIHIKSRRNEAHEKEAALKQASQYSHMSMDELLAEKGKAVRNLPDRK
jgi:hypothetical protein